MDGTKKEEYDEWIKNLGQTDNEPSIKKEKKYCECPSCADTREKRKKSSDPQRIIAYKLIDGL